MSGVASRNPFALLGDDADQVAAAAPAPKSAPAAAPTPSQTQRNVVGAGRGNNRPQRGGARGGAARAPRTEGGADAPSGEQRDSRRPQQEGRGGRGGRGRGRGGRGRGREFDRHSQTNKEDTDKQIRQAWGGEDGKRELETEENAEADAAAEGTEAAAAPNGAAAAEKPAPIEEEPDNTKTYDEYLAELAAKKATLGGGAKEARTAADEENWKNFSVTKAARDESEYFAATPKESTKAQKERKQKNILEIETRFESPRQERTERGGRGGRGRGAGRGGRGRGAARGGRGGSQSNASVNLADQSAFPSLG